MVPPSEQPASIGQTPGAPTARDGSASQAPSAGDQGVVVITGATGGIGAALAARYVQAGAIVVLVARSQDDLTALVTRLRAEHGGEVTAMAQDLTAPDAAQNLVAALDANGLFVDVLINNAALGLGKGLAQLTADEVRTTLDLNARAVTELTHAVLPGMRARGHGSVVMISSMAGLLAMPSAPLYSATKAYLFNLTKALRSELAGTGVSVSVVSSATVDTPMMHELGLGQFALFRAFTIQPAAVADAVFHGQRAGRFLIVPGLANTIGTYFLRAVAEPVVSSVWGSVHRLTARQPRSSSGPTP